jgi:two-component system LytT family response regulator
MILTRSVIVDDDINAADLLKVLLNKHFKHIEIISICNSVQNAVNLIDSEKPDLVFLDIELSDGYGFEVINQANYRQFDVIFITGFNNYAVQAFEFSALYYLLKPVNLKSLTEALERYRHKVSIEEIEKKLYVLENKISQNISRIMLPTGSGMEVFELDEIIRCEADDNYTVIYLKDKKYIMITKNLSNMEIILSDNGFFRVHRKFIINMKYIKNLKKNKKNPTIILSDGAEIPISEHRYHDFVSALERHIKVV